MIRILDISTTQDDIIERLKEYARQFDCKFVKSRADILFTNDVFLEEIRDIDLPKLKRVSSREDDISSIKVSDHVIFSSEELRDFYKEHTKSYSVITDANINSRIENLAMINKYYQIFEKYRTK